MNGIVKVVADVPSAFASLVKERFDTRAAADRYSIAFSGGSSARPCYEALAAQEINWSLVTAIWGDERLVPLDHEDSNYLATRQTLFDNVSAFGAVHPMQGSANDYEKIVGELEPIDFVHLGMGPDGHTLSLFPGSPVVDVVDRLVVETGDELHTHPRMTLTFSAVAQSRLAVFTIMGEKKAEMFARIVAGEPFPAARVAAHEVIWLVDAAAASSAG
jgi:6-phosphogluconolactonase